MHQCYLDLVTAGTACLLLEEASITESLAFRFTAVPLSQLVLKENANSRLDTTFRRSEMMRAKLLSRFPGAEIPEESRSKEPGTPEKKYAVIEAVIPDDGAYAYKAVLDPVSDNGKGSSLLLHTKEKIMFTLKHSVGRTGRNHKDDVCKIESLLGNSGNLDLRKTDGPTGFFGIRLEDAVK